MGEGGRRLAVQVLQSQRTVAGPDEGDPTESTLTPPLSRKREREKSPPTAKVIPQ